MADRLVHLTGVAKREVEAALGHELTPASPAGDQFLIPEEVALRIAELPPSPPKAEDSFRAKEAARALPLDVDELEPVEPAPAAEDIEAEDAVGSDVDADR